MFFRLRVLVVVGLVSILSLVGWKSFAYFFDKKMPQLTLSGMKENSYCCGDLVCSVASDKSGQISLWLDDQPLTRAYEGIKRNHEYPFTIPTQTLSNGKHVFKSRVN